MNLLCENCGATAAGGESRCSFCRSAIVSHRTESTNAEAPAIPDALQKLWKEGKVERCQMMILDLLRQQPKLVDNPDFLVLEVKVGFETEGAIGKIRGQLQRALGIHPGHAEAKEYAAIADAKEKIDVSAREVGVQGLRAVLKTSPKNPHALFLLGSTLFWGAQHAAEAMPYLERCTAVRPTFIRAWACLGAVYKTLGRDAFAAQAFKKCLELETNPKMIEYFRELQKR